MTKLQIIIIIKVYKNKYQKKNSRKKIYKQSKVLINYKNFKKLL